MMWSGFLLVLASAVACAVAADNENTGAEYPVGNPWYCLERAKAKGYNMEILGVLPGFGWDNLRNVNEGQVVFFNYSLCRTTEDGRFLLPDSVSAVPVKSSRLQYFAELISHWKTWTSTNSKSINIDAGFSRKLVSISGKFSYDFSDVKSKQVRDKSSTTRAQLRYIRYSVQLQPDSQLHPVFKKRVLGIAAAHALGEDLKANYLSEILVRDFGTHIISKSDAGAALIQVDQVKEAWVLEQTSSDKKKEILGSASANFFNYLNITLGGSYASKTSKEFLDAYTSKRTSSNIFTEGGPPFLPSGFTATSWAQSLDEDLVAMDRSGNPLYYVITEEALPELPLSTLRKVYDGIKEAVTTYYSYNRIPGCLDPASPNFSPSANVDDNTCKQPSTNLTFGGVYQTCRMVLSQNGDLCNKLQERNPLSGGFSCPSGYRSIKLRTGNTSSSRSEEKCERNWLFIKKCRTEHYISEAEYEMRWCVATSSIPAQSGYLFGGLFTSKVDNPVTRTRSCPPAFFPLKIGDQADLQICISDEHEFGQDKAVPFGGFYSCDAGNPIAVDNRPGPGDLGDFFEDKPSEWPKRCSPGYSAHLASVDQNCQINYCVTTGSLAGPVLPPIKRPPFSPDPPLSPPQTNGEFFFDPVSDTWTRNGNPQISQTTQTPETPQPGQPPNPTQAPQLTSSPLISFPSAGTSATLFSLWMLAASLSMSFISALQC